MDPVTYDIYEILDIPNFFNRKRALKSKHPQASEKISPKEFFNEKSNGFDLSSIGLNPEEIMKPDSIETAEEVLKKVKSREYIIYLEESKNIIKFAGNEKTSISLLNNLDKIKDDLINNCNKIIEILLIYILKLYPEEDNIYKISATFFTENLYDLNYFLLDNTQNKVINYEKLINDIIIENTDGFTKKMKDITSNKQEKINFFLVIHYMVNIIKNKTYEQNCELIQKFKILINKMNRKEFCDKSAWNNPNLKIYYLSDMIYLYLFFNRHNQTFFVDMIETPNKTESFKEIVKSYRAVENIFFNQWKLGNNIISKDDLFAVIYLTSSDPKNISITDERIFGYIYTMIPITVIIKKYLLSISNDKDKFKEICTKYFEILNDIKNKKISNVIYFVNNEEETQQKNVKYFINDATKIDEKEIFNTLDDSLNYLTKKNESSTNDNRQFIMNIQFANIISYLYPFYKLNINKDNAYLLKILTIEQGHICLNLNFEDVTNIKEFNEYFGISSIDNKNYDNRLYKMIYNYISTNFEKKMIDYFTKNKDKDKNENETQLGEQIKKIVKELYKKIIDFLKTNDIIELFKENSQLPTTLETDFIKEKIKIDEIMAFPLKKIEGKFGYDKQHLFFFKCIYSSLKKILAKSKEHYENYAKNIKDNFMEKKDSEKLNNIRKEYLSELYSLASEFPSFTKYLRNLNEYIINIILFDIDCSDYKSTEIVYKIIEMIIYTFNCDNDLNLKAKPTGSFIEILFTDPEFKDNDYEKNAKLIYSYTYFFSNKKYIYLLEKIAEYINIKDDLNYEDFNKNYDENDTRKYESLREFNEVFEISLESLLSKFINTDQNSVTLFYLERFDLMNFIINIAEKISQEKNIYSREIIRLKSIRLFLNHLNVNKSELNGNIESFDSIIEKINDKSSFYPEYKFDSLQKEIIEPLEKIKFINHKEEFILKYLYLEMSKFLFIRNNNNNNIFIDMIKMITKEYKYIINSKDFFNLLFSESIKLENYIDKLKKDESKDEDDNFLNIEIEELLEDSANEDIAKDTLIFEKTHERLILFIETKLNLHKDKNIKALEQILINIFENLLLKYFDGSKESNLFNRTAIRYIINAIKFLENNNKQEKLKNIHKLYYIAFLKVYFYGYFDIIDDDKKDHQIVCTNLIITNNLTDPKKQEIMSTQIVIQNYILKILRRRMDSYQSFKTYNFINHGLLWTEHHKFNQQKESYFDYVFLSSNTKTENENYENALNEITDLMIKLDKSTYRTGNYDNDIISYLNTGNYEIFLDYLFNNYLSKANRKEYTTGNQFVEFSMWINNLLKDKSLFNSNQKIREFFTCLFSTEKKENLSYFEKYFIYDKDNDGNFDFKKLEIILISLKLSFPFIIKGFDNLVELDKKIDILKQPRSENYLNNMIFADMAKHCEKNKFSINNNYYKKIDVESEIIGSQKEEFKEKWKLININDIDEFYQSQKLNFCNERCVSEIQENITKDEPSLEKSLKVIINKKMIYFNTMISTKHYDLIHHQYEKLDLDDLKIYTSNLVLVYVLYSLHYYLKIHDTIFKRYTKNISEEINPYFLESIYNDLVKCLHLLSINNEKIFFNVLYNEIKISIGKETQINPIINNLSKSIIDLINKKYNENKNEYLEYINEIMEYDREEERNILEDQKINYEKEEMLPNLYYFYYPSYPTLENFEYYFNGIYQSKFKFPLIHFIISEISSNSLEADNVIINRDLANRMIDCLFLYGNDHTKSDIKFYMNYKNQNKFSLEKEDFEKKLNFIDLIRRYSFRNIYGFDEINYCNGDIIEYELDELEMYLENILIDRCKQP